METKTLPLAANCVVCGVPLVGLAAVFLRWRGIRRSPRNPNCCTQCGAHLEEGRLVEMTVVFADLSSFTEMTGRLGATATYSVVDEFLRLASTTLMSHGAFIDKYIGDAVMALFNVPIKRADHAAAAVAAAAKLQELLPGLSERLGTSLQASIGIASGFARVGRLGSDDIKDYTAIGDAVNQAARLQAQAGATEIVVSQEVYREVASAYPGVAAESLTLKGFPQPTVAYRLNGKPRSVLSAASWISEDRPVMNWSAVTLAILGSGCLGSNIAAALVLAFGGSSAAAFFALARWFDNSPARVPLLVVSALIASVVLVSLERQRRMRRDCIARRSCLEMTPQERRQVRLATGLAVASLTLIALELLMHYAIGQPLVRLHHESEFPVSRKEVRMKTARMMALAVLMVASTFALPAARAQQPGIKRTDLQRHDLSAPGREAVQVRVELAPIPRAPGYSLNAAQLEIAYICKLAGTAPREPVDR